MELAPQHPVSENIPGSPPQGVGARVSQAELDAARRYDDWYATPQGSRGAKAEESLLDELLDLLGPVQTALDVGCGTGHFARWLAASGIEATGLDVSDAMLAVAEERGPGNRFLQGTAEALPLADKSFDVTVLITSLEFVDNQERVFAEAARVARRGLLLGVLNLASPLGMYRKALSRFRPSRYRRARFFTPWGLEAWLRHCLGDRVERVDLRTTLWPRDLPLGASRLPFGAFIGAVVVF
ncbi:MAG: class I SAM-dependent methyltransferase, partial [Actinobacteria bacterium]|nr:class I SAM-dependent methyltransferase [Actinomycetota bacterium]